MHEFGIVHNIEEQVRQLLKQHHAQRPTKLVVKACVLDGISEESMSFAFQHMIEEAGWEDAKLELQIEPASATCQDCQHRFKCQPDELTCPNCGSEATRVDVSPGPVLMSVEMEQADV